MADFVWAQENISKISRFNKLYGNNILQPTENMKIFGIEGTYTYMPKGDDFITVLGYCCYPGESIKTTILRIFNDFDESKISELKKKLIGQFIIIIKKGFLVYIFGDNWQIRNVFYSKDLKLISSSFSVIEDILGANIDKLDNKKVLEYIALRHFSYPGWLGNKTIHTDIKCLRPFEYIMIDTLNFNSHIGEICFDIDNNKEHNLNKISSELVTSLKAVIENPFYKEKEIGITLTGGYDSRLVATIAANYYKKASFRIATSKNAYGSLKDAKIAKKIANVLNIPLRIYNSTVGEDLLHKFYFFSEGLSPKENSVITPIIEETRVYTLGLGGCFGTEHFMSLDRYSNIEDFINESILKAKSNIQATEDEWKQLRFSMLEEFKDIEKHYILSVPNALDKVRIFILLRTAFFSSFMLSAYNIKGLQVEPYSYFKLLEIALKIPEEYIRRGGKSRNTSLVQKKAMLEVSYNIGKIITTHYQPMLPYTIWTSPYYLWGHFIVFYGKVINKIKKIHKNGHYRKRVIINNDIGYFSDGWDELFLRRMRERYDLHIDIVEMS